MKRKPKDRTELPLGVLRRSNKEGYSVYLLSAKNGWLDKRWVNLIGKDASLKNYYVLSVDDSVEEFDSENRVFKFKGSDSVKQKGFTSFERAQSEYIKTAKETTKKNVQKWNINSHFKNKDD